MIILDLNTKDPTQAATGVPPVPAPIEPSMPSQPVAAPSATPDPSVAMPTSEPSVSMSPTTPPVDPTVPTVPDMPTSGVAESDKAGGPQGGTPPVTPTY